MDIETAARLIGAKKIEVVSVEETADGTVIRTAGGPPLIVVDGTVMLFGALVAPDADGKPMVVETRLPVFEAPVDEDGDEPADVEPEPTPAPKATKKAAAKKAVPVDEDGDDE